MVWVLGAGTNYNVNKMLISHSSVLPDTKHQDWNLTDTRLDEHIGRLTQRILRLLDSINALESLSLVAQGARRIWYALSPHYGHALLDHQLHRQLL